MWKFNIMTEQPYINNYDPYILNEVNINNYLKCKTSSVFFPREQDSLFWCYYIILNGEFKYEILHVKNSLIAKQIKIDFVTKIRENKPIVKMYKFDTITSLESNLANDDNINIKTVITLCAIENINIVFIKKKLILNY